MPLKILAIGDTASIVSNLQKVFDGIEMHIIEHPRVGGLELEIGKNFEFFTSFDVREQIKKILKIKDEYDICLVTGWASTRLAYLCDLNYIIYFVGDDIKHPSFEKFDSDLTHNGALMKYNIFERYFYRRILDNALYVVANFDDRYKILKKYRKDAIQIDNVFYEFNIPSLTKQKQNKNFQFFSPSRIGFLKGFDIIFKAIKMCKTEFEVLQVEWWDSYLNVKEINDLKQLIPTNVKLIPLIKQNEMWQYYVNSDAVIAGMGRDYPEFVAIEGIMCQKPTISFANPETKYYPGNMKIRSTFLPNSKDPKILSELLDKLVESEQFRNELLSSETDFVKLLINKKETKKKWEELFFQFKNNRKTINKKSSRIFIKFRYLLFLLIVLINKINRKLQMS
jgi:glycosyltransferase involved in cell wall biosynthesis